MKITIRPLFGKIKDFALEYTKAFLSMFAGIITIAVSAIFQLHSITQWEMICSDAIWQTPKWIALNPQLLIHPASVGIFIDGPIYQGTVGGAYDFFLGMNTVGWILALVGMFLLMLGIILFYRAVLSEARAEPIPRETYPING